MALGKSYCIAGTDCAYGYGSVFKVVGHLHIRMVFIEKQIRFYENYVYHLD